MKYSLFASALFALALSPALATMYITHPVSKTKADGGDSMEIEWKNKGSPALSKWDGINLWLATGNDETQYKLHTIASNLSTSRTSYKFKVPTSAGPSGDYYFIRAESTKKFKNDSSEYQSYSAKFTLNDMKGKFNSTLLAAAKGSSSSSSSTNGTSSSKNPSTTTSSSVSPATSTPNTSNSTTTPASKNTTSGAEALLSSQQFVFGAVGAVAAGVAVLL